MGQTQQLALLHDAQVWVLRFNERSFGLNGVLERALSGKYPALLILTGQARHKLLAQGYQLGRSDLLNMDDHIKALR